MSQRQNFFDRQVHMSEWKDSMAGKNEIRAIEILKDLGYELGKDFVRQHPIGERFVLDFAFVKEQVAIEIDGQTHNRPIQRKKDRQRDNYLNLNNWVPLRIKESWLFGYKGSFYKSLIKQVVEERRAQWEVGSLYAIDIPNFKEEDYATPKTTLAKT